MGGRGPLGETAIKASVLMLTGLSVAVAFTVGLFNIGGEGQLIWGGLAAAVAGRLDSPLALPLSLVAAAPAGGAPGGPAGGVEGGPRGGRRGNTHPPHLGGHPLLAW